MNKILASAAVALSLYGCGGGGGSSGPDVVASTLDFPVDAALSNYFQAPHHYALDASFTDGSSGTASYAYAPNGGTTSFNGQTVLSGTETLSASNGTNTATDYFTVSPFNDHGNTSNGEDTVPDSLVTLPTTAKVGQSGSYGTATTYTDAGHTQIAHTESDRWSLEADTANTAWLCISYTQSDGVTGKSCYEIDASGNTLGIKGSFTDSSGTSSYHS